MKNHFSTTLKTVLIGTIVVFLTSLFTANAQTICNNEINTQGDYTYEFWKDYGNGCMVLGDEGAFSVEWSDISNMLAKKGLRPGSWDNIITYAADFQPHGNSYLCAYGWTANPLVEYYIIESWGSWRPPGEQGFMGTINSDGGTYEIFKTRRIVGSEIYIQYWSIRLSKRTSGTITVGNHFRAWEDLDMPMGDLIEVTFCVEAYQSNGTADIYSMFISNAPPEPTLTPTEYENGDVDGNGVIDIIDALLIAKYYVGIITPGMHWDLADTNCDKIIDIIDALNVARYSVDLISYLPDCT
ncbi:MAG: glycoside hydrolase family 11 protein [Spirochaetales bacterium]|nr:glycoside hydrolase family 11 protein [Spirochaetales bacterium]